MPFGLLSYHTSNLGDFIQSLAAHKFLPKVDGYIDREALDDVGPIEGKPVKLIMNGWFCHRPDKWPPSPFINPLLISVHITNNPEPGSEMRAREHFARSPQVLRYLQEHAPIGARDHDTLAWLRSFGIDTYYSGCLTLTLDRPAVPREPFIVLNEVPDSGGDESSERDGPARSSYQPRRSRHGWRRGSPGAGGSPDRALCESVVRRDHPHARCAAVPGHGHTGSPSRDSLGPIPLRRSARPGAPLLGRGFSVGPRGLRCQQSACQSRHVPAVARRIGKKCDGLYRRASPDDLDHRPLAPAPLSSTLRRLEIE